MFTMEITRLIERCRLGDADALGELYKAYAQQMRGVCRRYISDEQTVEDVDDVLHKSLSFVPLEAAEALVASNEDITVKGVPLEEVLKLIDKLPEGYGKVFRLSLAPLKLWHVNRPLQPLTYAPTPTYCRHSGTLHR